MYSVHIAMFYIFTFLKIFKKSLGNKNILNQYLKPYPNTQGSYSAEIPEKKSINTNMIFSQIFFDVLWLIKLEIL